MICRSPINACARLARDGALRVCVTKAILQHTHELSKLVYQQYASARLALSEDMVHTFDLLRMTGAKKRSTQRHIVENSDAQPNLKDIGNLIARLKTCENQGMTTAQVLHKWMKEFCEEAAGNI